MVDFATDTNFNLTAIDVTDVNKNIYAMLVDGEKVISAYKTVRDQVVFTNKRIIAMDKQGITGKRQLYSTLPYKMIQYFNVQTVGFAELIPDAELEMWAANGRMFHFEFKGKCDIIAIGKVISTYVLD
ncbi:MAG: PH domain-containing protein [archaeon]|nr:PH domain-containing protein [archaeon]